MAAASPPQPPQPGPATALLPRRLIFVRHALSEANESHAVRFTQPDYLVPLSAAGLAQAIAAAGPGAPLRALLQPAQPPVPWVTSPYLRTQQTAAVLRQELAAAGVACAGAAALPCPLLHERLYPNVSFGSHEGGQGWVGFTQDERERFARAEAHAGYYFFRSPGGENSVGVGARAEALLQWLARAGLGSADTVVLVSHSSCITDMCTWLLDTPPHLAERAGSVPNCSATVLLRCEPEGGGGAAHPPPPAAPGEAGPRARYALDPASALAAGLARARGTATWGQPGWVADSLRRLGYRLPSGSASASGCVGEAKAAARAAAARALAALPPAARAQQSAAVCARLAALPQWASARTVALYLPLRPGAGAGGGGGGCQEVDVEPLLGAALRAGKRVLLPRVTGSGAGDMTMLQVASEGDVAGWAPAGAWGLREPPLEAPGEGLLLRADWRTCWPELVVVPGVAFDARGGRLGRGRGYYDAWLARVREEAARAGRAPPYLVAGALAPQVLPLGQALPCEAWDVPLHCVVGPEHTHTPGEGGSE